MAATSFGSGSWGIASDEAGLIINSLGFSYSQDSQEIRNRVGDVVGVTKYNERTEISVDASVPAASAFSGALADELSLTNSIPDHLQGGVAGGTIVIEGIDVTHEAEGYKAISISAIHYPFVN